MDDHFPYSITSKGLQQGGGGSHQAVNNLVKILSRSKNQNQISLPHLNKLAISYANPTPPQKSLNYLSL